MPNCDFSGFFFGVKNFSVRKIELSYRVEQNVWPFQFSLQLEYSFGKISSPNIEILTFFMLIRMKERKRWFSETSETETGNLGRLLNESNMIFKPKVQKFEVQKSKVRILVS